MKVNLTFGTNPEITQELIISEAGGKILLDTVAPGDIYIHASLATNEKLVDVTIKSVDPSKWVTTYGAMYYLPDPPNTAGGGSVFYTHFPRVGFNNYVVSNTINKAAFGYDNDDVALTATAYYQPYNGNNVYLLMPDLGLYNLHKPAGAKDTVDLSHMDTAVSVKFSINAGLKANVVSLNAIFDSTKVSQGVSFFPRDTRLDAADLVYPPASAVPVQKYELQVGVLDNPSSMSFYSYDRTVPTDFHFPVASDYTLSSKEQNNFTVKYNGNKPTYYTIRWLHAGGTWTIDVPADSTTINPSALPLFKGTKLYNGTLTDMQLQGFQTATVAGFTYGDYWNYTCDPATVHTGKIKSVYTYLINFL